MLGRLVERLLIAFRWLLAPIYLGLALALVALALKFFQESIHLVTHVFSEGEQDLVLGILALVDLSLVAALALMVMMSGYENFVSKIRADEASEIAWISKLDSGTLKLKVAASIVAISSIHLLRIFMELPQIPNDKVAWYAGLHLTFVVSALLLGVLDRISFAAQREAKASAAAAARGRPATE
jgi:uncharacterized protein (TIGR00645 family)